MASVIDWRTRHGPGKTVNATSIFLLLKARARRGGGLGTTLALDDFAYAVVPPHGARRVLLVTPGNPPLEDALRSLPGLRLAVVPPDGYPHAGAHDAAVFDRFAPAEPPAAGALLFRPPARKWFAGHSPALARTRITSWNEDHAVTGGIAWRNLRLARASLSDEINMDAEALVLANGSASAAVVTAGFSKARWIQVGFALHDSNFPLQPDFPVFLGNALNWLSAPIPVLLRGLGSVEVELPGAYVRDSNGNSVAASVTAKGVVFEASRPDVYTVRSPSGDTRVVANVSDPRYAQINHSRLSDGGATALQPTRRIVSSAKWGAADSARRRVLLFEWGRVHGPRVCLMPKVTVATLWPLELMAACAIGYSPAPARVSGAPARPRRSCVVGLGAIVARTSYDPRERSISVVSF